MSMADRPRPCEMGRKCFVTCPECEDLERARPVTGFFSSLTPDQQERALSYRGPENIGEGGLRLDAQDGSSVGQADAVDDAVLTLRAGHAYRRRDGSACHIMAANPRSGHVWWTDDGVYLDENGRSPLGYRESDIVAEVGTAADAAYLRGQSGGLPNHFSPFYDAPQTFAEVWRVQEAALAIILSPEVPSFPIAGTEPWEMADDEFAALVAKALGHPVVYRGEMLDEYAYDAAEMIRPRLVRVEA